MEEDREADEREEHRGDTMHETGSLRLAERPVQGQHRATDSHDIHAQAGQWHTAVPVSGTDTSKH